MSSLNATWAGAKHNKSLKIVFIITAICLISKAAVGVVSNSLALLSDAAHLLLAVGVQALALFAIWITSRRFNKRKTYSYYKIEILSALACALMLIFISGYMLFEAWQRFKNPPKVAGLPMLIAACGGLIINLMGVKILSAGAKENFNIKRVYNEVVCNMLSSVAALITSILILATGWLYIDPVMSACIALFILSRTVTLLKLSVDILPATVPTDIDYAAVEKCITDKPGVQSVCDLHIWTISSDVIALCAQVIMKANTNSTEISDVVRSIKEQLASAFKITQTTIEVHKERGNYLDNLS